MSDEPKSTGWSVSGTGFVGSLYTVSSTTGKSQTTFTTGACGKPGLTFNVDGTVKIGNGLTPDEAGAQAIAAMSLYFAGMIEAAKKNVHDEFERHGYKIIDGEVHRKLDEQWVRIIRAD